MARPPDTIIEERQELMVSPSGGDPTLRTAHFLKPSVTSIDGPVFQLPSHCLSASTATSEPGKLPLKVAFHGWRCRQKKWKIWVDRMHSLHQSIWKKAGIYEAILGSTCEIQRNDDLILGIAESWCSETNTFIFPWGETTITLEDMMILGGYAVLGDPVSRPLKTTELKEIEKELIEARLQISRSKSHKACQYAWMGHFTENESKFEHEAFLSLWLSRFVFPGITMGTIQKYAFSIAIHLARGTPLALAPAVLASLYRDLSLLKEKVGASAKFKTGKDNVLSLTLWAPLQLVQIWALERFPTLHPKPNSIAYDEPRLARWHKVKHLKVENVRLALDSAGDFFRWRPYAAAVNKWSSHKFCGEKEECMLVNDFDEELQSLARCWRVSELVGLDCIEQYLPHRVAMQFGMDQDVPGHVGRFNETSEIAWNNYSRLIRDVNLYIPSRLFEPDVTTRYLEWWKQSVSAQKVAIPGVMGQQISPKCLKRSPQISNGNKGDDHLSVPPGFPPKSRSAEAGDSINEDKLTSLELLKYSENHKKTEDRWATYKYSSSSTVDDGAARKTKIVEVEDSTEQCKYYHLSAPAGFPMKYKGVETEESMRGDKLTVLEQLVEVKDSIKEDKHTLSELLKSNDKPRSIGNRQAGEKCSSSDCSQSPTADDRAAKKMKPLLKLVENTMWSKAAMGGSECAMDDENKRQAESLANNMVRIADKEEENGSYCTFEIPGLELETRIRKLERLVSGLKAKSLHSFRKKLHQSSV